MSIKGIQPPLYFSFLFISSFILRGKLLFKGAAETSVADWPTRRQETLLLEASGRGSLIDHVHGPACVHTMVDTV